MKKRQQKKKKKLKFQKINIDLSVRLEILQKKKKFN